MIAYQCEAPVHLRCVVEFDMLRVAKLKHFTRAIELGRADVVKQILPAVVEHFSVYAIYFQMLQCDDPQTFAVIFEYVNFDPEMRKSALQMMVMKGRLGIVKYIIEVCGVEASPYLYKYAACNGDVNMVDYLTG